jgi:hypothetical protein
MPLCERQHPPVESVIVDTDDRLWTTIAQEGVEAPTELLQEPELQQRLPESGDAA